MKISYIKFRLFITGIYAWGKGWLREDYPSRWNDMCLRLHEGTDGSIYKFRASILRDNDGHGACERFYSDDFYAYMHPMDVTGHAMTSEYCPGSAEEHNGEMRAMLTKLAKVIRDAFPELDLDMRVVLNEHVFDTDNIKNDTFNL